MRLSHFILAASIFAITSCKKKEVVPDGAVAAKTILNVSYGTDALQNMDVYLPAGRTTASTKVLVMIHGGGWYSGDKADAVYQPFVDSIRRRFPEYAIFNINYRLSAAPSNLFPAQENDVKAALTFIYGKSSEYLISDKYILAGASAGAHLAMLQAYKYSVPVKPKAVVSFFGPSDLTDMYNNPVGGNPALSLALASVIGKTPSQDAAIYTNSSPVTFISASSAMPTILLHGGTDVLVNASQSVAVKNKLTTAGISNQYVFYATGGHGDWNNATYFDAFTKIEAFLRLYVP